MGERTGRGVEQGERMLSQPTEWGEGNRTRSARNGPGTLRKKDAPQVRSSNEDFRECDQKKSCACFSFFSFKRKLRDKKGNVDLEVRSSKSTHRWRLGEYPPLFSHKCLVLSLTKTTPKSIKERITVFEAVCKTLKKPNKCVCCFTDLLENVLEARVYLSIWLLFGKFIFFGCKAQPSGSRGSESHGWSP